jgi:hypothetical protein
MDLSDHDVELANRRGKALLARTPTVLRARFNRQDGRVHVLLSSGLVVAFKASDTEGLGTATDDQLKEIEISPSGLGLHWPRIDADVYLPALLEGLLGSRRWMASSAGRKGGAATSEVKQAAARANGRRGGRPCKSRELETT